MLPNAKFLALGGLTNDEAAEAVGMKLRTMQRMWSDARQWLFEHTGSSSADESAG
jgi:ECF sigma factor